MNRADVKARVETLKAIARGVWFAILGVVAAGLVAVASSGAISDINVQVAGAEVNVTVVIIAVVGFIAKAIDTYVHKNENLNSNGIAPSFLQK